MLAEFVQHVVNGLILGSGYALMGIGLTLNRQQKVRTPVAFALMGGGTVLVFLGLYVATPATS